MNSATSREIAAPPLNAYFKSPAEARAHLREDELVGQPRASMLLGEREAFAARAAFAVALSADFTRLCTNAGCSRDLLLHGVVELVEDARNAEEQRRLHLGEVVDDLLVDSAERHARAAREERVQLARLAERVRPRQKRKRAIVVVHREDVVHRVHVRRDVAVREDDALRVAGRAARVDETRTCPLCRVDRRGRPCSRSCGATRTSTRCFRLVAVIETHDVLERRDSVEELLRLLDDRVGRRRRATFASQSLDDELPLLVVLRLVHRHERGAETEARVRGDGPLDAVVAMMATLSPRSTPSDASPPRNASTSAPNSA